MQTKYNIHFFVVFFAIIKKKTNTKKTGEEMEWLMCLNPQYEPSSFIEEFNGAGFELFGKDPCIHPFLEDFVDKLGQETWLEVLDNIYCPPSSSGFLKKIVLKFPQEYQALKLIKKYDKIFHFNLQYLDSKNWQPDLTDGDILNPTNMKKYLESKRHDQDDVITNLFYSYNYVSFAQEFLETQVNKQLVDILRTKMQTDTNLYSIIMFVKQWKPSTLALTDEKRKFIQSLSPLTAQLLFVSPPCWYDSKDDACSNCNSFDEDLFLPQWQCLAQCDDNAKKCHRFARPHESFCSFHQLQKPSKFRKRTYDKPLKNKDATKNDYEANPNSFQQQPIRFHYTNRPVSAMNKLLPSYKRTRKAPSGYYLPIIRYENIYYSQDTDDETKKQEYCGKFFYFEPESNIYLHLGKSCFFASKVDAYMTLHYLKWQLQRSLNPKSFLHGVSVNLQLNKFKLFATNGAHVKGVLEKILDMNTITESVRKSKVHEDEEFWDKFLTYRYRTLFLSAQDFDKDWHSKILPVFYPTDKIRLGGKPLPSNVGAFDYLDQDICHSARQFGFDTVVLQHEVGGHDSVTEIIHTRENFEDFLYEFKDVETDLLPQTMYPKIWLPTENGILAVDDKAKKAMISINETNINQIFTNYGSNFFNKTGPSRLKKSKPSSHVNWNMRPFPILSDSEYESEQEEKNV